MDTIELSDATATPIQVVGLSFYFDLGNVKLAGAQGLRRFQFYGLGRGGVLRDDESQDLCVDRLAKFDALNAPVTVTE